MNGFFRKISVMLIISACLTLFGQKSVKMSVSSTEMFKNDAFELEIRFENFESDISVEYPSFKDLIKISGPYQSSSTSIINGAVTKSLVLTYQFAPSRTGRITIGPAAVTDGGKKYTSNEIAITVFEQGKAGSSDSRDIFITAQVSDNDVYVGEMIRIDYTLYVKPELKIRMPSLSEEPKFTNFVKETIDIPQEQARTLTQTIYKGQKYNYLPLRSYWISPTSSGEKKIESLSSVVPVEVKSKTRRKDPFFNDPFFSDDIFSGFSNYKDRPVLSDEVKVTVRSLPEEGKPSGFSGAVGSYKLTSSIDRDSVQVNDAVNLKITVSGRGNLNDITVVKPEIPKDFEVYDPKRTVIFDKGSKNSGRVVFEYLLLARNPGKHKVNNIIFSYFDPSDNKYKTVNSKGHFISVGGEVSQERIGAGFKRREVEVLASDIRYIKKNAGTFYKKADKKLSAADLITHLLIAFGLVLLSFIANYFFSKNSGNVARTRNRKAVKNALKRLKDSYRSLDKKDSTGFYKNLDEALLKFIADKFNISHAGIIVDDIAEGLKDKGIDEKTIEEMKAVLNKSASAQFAPVKPEISEMSSDISRVKELMININERLKQRG